MEQAQVRHCGRQCEHDSHVQDDGAMCTGKWGPDPEKVAEAEATLDRLREEIAAEQERQQVAGRLEPQHVVIDPQQVNIIANGIGSGRRRYADDPEADRETAVRILRLLLIDATNRLRNTPLDRLVDDVRTVAAECDANSVAAGDEAVGHAWAQAGRKLYDVVEPYGKVDVVRAEDLHSRASREFSNLAHWFYRVGTDHSTAGTFTGKIRADVWHRASDLLLRAMQAVGLSERFADGVPDGVATEPDPAPSPADLVADPAKLVERAIVEAESGDTTDSGFVWAQIADSAIRLAVLRHRQVVDQVDALDERARELTEAEQNVESRRRALQVKEGRLDVRSTSLDNLERALKLRMTEVEGRERKLRERERAVDDERAKLTANSDHVTGDRDTMRLVSTGGTSTKEWLKCADEVRAWLNDGRPIVIPGAES